MTNSIIRQYYNRVRAAYPEVVIILEIKDQEIAIAYDEGAAIVAKMLGLSPPGDKQPQTVFAAKHTLKAVETIVRLGVKVAFAELTTRPFER